MTESEKDIETYLARIRKTIADGRNAVSQAELRIAETDRMLERQGLTREQVLAMRFSEAQIEAANEELKRCGFDPLEQWQSEGVENSTFKASDFQTPAMQPSADSGEELATRQRKFGMMMKPFQI